LTYSYKVVELPFNMSTPPALLTKRPEADNSFEDRPLAANGGSPAKRGSITNFQESNGFVPGSANSLTGLKQTINEAAARKPLEVHNNAVLDAIGAK